MGSQKNLSPIQVLTLSHTAADHFICTSGCLFWLPLIFCRQNFVYGIDEFYGHRHPLLTADLSRSVPEKWISSTVKQTKNCCDLIRRLWFSFIQEVCSTQTGSMHGARGYSTIIPWKEIYGFKIWLWQTTVQEISQLENKFHKPVVSGKYISWVNRGVLHVSIWVVRCGDLGLCGPVFNKCRGLTINGTGHLWKNGLCGL